MRKNHIKFIENKSIVEATKLLLATKNLRELIVQIDSCPAHNCGTAKLTGHLAQKSHLVLWQHDAHLLPVGVKAFSAECLLIASC